MQERKGREADLGKEQGQGEGSKGEETGERKLQRYMCLSFHCLGDRPHTSVSGSHDANFSPC